MSSHDDAVDAAPAPESLTQEEEEKVAEEEEEAGEEDVVQVEMPLESTSNADEYSTDAAAATLQPLTFQWLLQRTGVTAINELETSESIDFSMRREDEEENGSSAPSASSHPHTLLPLTSLSLPLLLSLQHIQSLNLSYNSLTSLNGIQCLNSLRVLEVSHNKLESLEDLGRIPEDRRCLESLFASHNCITSLSPLPHFTATLHTLSISYNCITEEAELQYLSEMYCMTSLFLGGNEVMRRMKRVKGVEEEEEKEDESIDNSDDNADSDDTCYHNLCSYCSFHLPWLTSLNGIDITDEERSDAWGKYSEQMSASELEQHMSRIGEMMKAGGHTQEEEAEEVDEQAEQEEENEEQTEEIEEKDSHAESQVDGAEENTEHEQQQQEDDPPDDLSSIVEEDSESALTPSQHQRTLADNQSAPHSADERSMYSENAETEGEEEEGLLPTKALLVPTSAVTSTTHSPLLVASISPDNTSSPSRRSPLSPRRQAKLLAMLPPPMTTNTSTTQQQSLSPATHSPTTPHLRPPHHTRSQSGSDYSSSSRSPSPLPLASSNTTTPDKPKLSPSHRRSVTSGGNAATSSSARRTSLTNPNGLTPQRLAAQRVKQHRHSSTTTMNSASSSLSSSPPNTDELHTELLRLRKLTTEQSHTILTQREQLTSFQHELLVKTQSLDNKIQECETAQSELLRLEQQVAFMALEREFEGEDGGGEIQYQKERRNGNNSRHAMNGKSSSPPSRAPSSSPPLRAASPSVTNIAHFLPALNAVPQVTLIETPSFTLPPLSPPPVLLPATPFTSSLSSTHLNQYVQYSQSLEEILREHKSTVREKEREKENCERRVEEVRYEMKIVRKCMKFIQNRNNTSTTTPLSTLSPSSYTTLLSSLTSKQSSLTTHHHNLFQYKHDLIQLQESLRKREMMIDYLKEVLERGIDDETTLSRHRDHLLSTQRNLSLLQDSINSLETQIFHTEGLVRKGEEEVKRWKEKKWMYELTQARGDNDIESILKSLYNEESTALHSLQELTPQLPVYHNRSLELTSRYSQVRSILDTHDVMMMKQKCEGLERRVKRMSVERDREREREKKIIPPLPLQSILRQPKPQQQSQQQQQHHSSSSSRRATPQRFQSPSSDSASFYQLNSPPPQQQQQSQQRQQNYPPQDRFSSPPPVGSAYQSPLNSHRSMTSQSQHQYQHDNQQQPITITSTPPPHLPPQSLQLQLQNQNGNLITLTLNNSSGVTTTTSSSSVAMNGNHEPVVMNTSAQPLPVLSNTASTTTASSSHSSSLHSSVAASPIYSPAGMTHQRSIAHSQVNDTERQQGNSSQVTSPRETMNDDRNGHTQPSSRDTINLSPRSSHIHSAKLNQMRLLNERIAVLQEQKLIMEQAVVNKAFDIIHGATVANGNANGQSKTMNGTATQAHSTTTESSTSITTHATDSKLTATPPTPAPNGSSDRHLHPRSSTPTRRIDLHLDDLLTPQPPTKVMNGKSNGTTAATKIVSDQSTSTTPSPLLTSSTPSSAAQPPSHPPAQMSTELIARLTAHQQQQMVNQMNLKKFNEGENGNGSTSLVAINGHGNANITPSTVVYTTTVIPPALGLSDSMLFLPQPTPVFYPVATTAVGTPMTTSMLPNPGYEQQLLLPPPSVPSPLLPATPPTYHYSSSRNSSSRVSPSLTPSLSHLHPSEELLDPHSRSSSPMTAMKTLHRVRHEQTKLIRSAKKEEKRWNSSTKPTSTPPG